MNNKLKDINEDFVKSLTELLPKMVFSCGCNGFDLLSYVHPIVWIVAISDLIVSKSKFSIISRYMAFISLIEIFVAIVVFSIIFFIKRKQMIEFNKYIIEQTLKDKYENEIDRFKELSKVIMIMKMSKPKNSQDKKEIMEKLNKLWNISKKTIGMINGENFSKLFGGEED